MLCIGRISAGQESYYTDLASGSYYTESGEPAGQWFGKGSADLGLRGEVDQETLANLLRGFTPDGRTAMVKNAGAGADRRAGFDLTFGAPKSVSVLWSQADKDLRDAIQAAHRKAVRAALGYVEDVALFTRRGAGGERLEKAKLVAAVFDHSSARPENPGAVPDPHIHTHCLVQNLNPGGGTIHGTKLYQHAMTAGVLYRAELFCQLRAELGLGVSRREKWCEIDGVPKELCDVFSKRTKAIQTYMQEKGLSGAKGAQKAVLETRSGKTEVDVEKLRAHWREVGKAHGFNITADLFGAAAHPDPRRAVRDAVLPAAQKLTERKSLFGEKDLIRAVADAVESHGVGVDAICQGVAEVLRQSPELVALGKRREEPKFTTRDLLRVEQQLFRDASELAHRMRDVRDGDLRDVLQRRSTLSREQRTALEHVTSGGALRLVQGMAGTGKTFMLRAAAEAWGDAGYRVHGAALAAAAASRLQEDSGIESRTLHRTLALIRRGELRLDSKSVLVVDEAGMLGTRKTAEIIAVARKTGAKLVLVGDRKQLQAIDAGSPFAALSERHGAAVLEEIRRQRQDWAKRSVHDFAHGKAAAALEEFDRRGLLTVAETRKEVLQRLVSDWQRAAASGGLSETLVLTGTRAESTMVNRMIQQAKFASGLLSPECVALRSGEAHVGDRIIFRRNTGLFNNGDRATVTRVDRAARTLTAKLDSGTRVTVDLADYDHVELGYASTTHSAQGASVERCLVLCGGVMTDRESTYVQASRAREETRLYVDIESAEEGMADVVRLMQRSRQQEMALDAMEANVPELLLEVA